MLAFMTHDPMRWSACSSTEWRRANSQVRYAGGTARLELRCCAVQGTRLDTARIRAARRIIDPVFLDTPLYHGEALERSLGCTVSVRLETANPVRSFKARGTEVVASLLTTNGSPAVVCASAGNLGQALAWSGRGRGLDVTVVTTDSTDTIADAVAGRCPIPAVLNDLLLVADDAVLVQETSIIAGMRVLLEDAGLVVEPSAALGIAAILMRAYRRWAVSGLPPT